MRKSRFSEEQIKAILSGREPGQSAMDVCRKHGISSATYYKWKAKYGETAKPAAKRPPPPSTERQAKSKIGGGPVGANALRKLEDENARLKRLLGECLLENAMLKDMASLPGND